MRGRGGVVPPGDTAGIERVTDGLVGERPEAGDAQHADLQAARAQFVHHVLDRAEHRAERDHDDLRIVEPVRPDQPAGVPAELDAELGRDRRDDLQGLLHAFVGQVAHLGERLGADHGADRDRLGRVEHLSRVVPRQECVHLSRVRDVGPLASVGEQEAVHADHDRDRQPFRDPEGLDVQVEGLLVGLGVELEPARVALGHRVAVVVPDVDRRADRAVRDRHHDRQAEPGRVIDRFAHVEQALAGGRGVGAGPGRGRPDGHRQGGELRFHVEELGVQLAFLDHGAQRLDDVGLRGDRVGTDHLGAAHGHRLSHRAGSLDLLKHGSAPPAHR